MSRKVFISFLGTNNYTECVYQFGTQESSVVKYIQTALAELFVKENGNKYFVFTTDRAAAANWHGLQDEVKKITPSISVEQVEITNGENVNEIWQNFQTIYDTLEPNDELTVDITHSFRSLPLIASALLQYAKFLKNITVKAIYYGAFEKLGNPRDIAEKIPVPKDRIVSVFDLTIFTEIQDWATAANEFTSFGNAKRLNQLTNSCIGRMLQNAGPNQMVQGLSKLKAQLEKLSGAIKTNRGQDLIKGDAAEKIIAALQSIEQDCPVAALNPVLEKIKDDVQKVFVARNDARNMLAAVEWCIDKQLIQEGFTILQEGIITLLITAVLLQTDYVNQDKRKVVSGYLQKRDKFENKTALSDNKVKQLTSQLSASKDIDRISLIYKNIANARNDISHAGMGNSQRRAEKFDKELRELYEQTKTAFGL